MDIATGETAASHAHSLLHVNLNTRDVEAAARFYVERLGMTIGMTTSSDPVDGSMLGVPGLTRSIVHFVYDDRGPRTAPAIELLGWLDPPPVGDAPEPGRPGIAAIGFAANSLPPQEFSDFDGVPIEIVAGDTSPRLSYLRFNVTNLEASLEWYERIGFTRESDDLRLGETQFLLTQVDSDESPISPATHIGLYRIALGVDDVEAAARELGGPAPIWVQLPGTRLGGVHVLFLTDPDGVVVELVGRPRSSMR